MQTEIPNSVIIHYGELALKGENRPLFVHRLIENIRKATHGLGLGSVVTPRGRVILQLKEGASWEAMVNRLRQVIGIANFAPAWRCNREIGAIEKTVFELISDQRFESFRIAARRGDKGYPITSMEVNERLGQIVREKTGARVDLTNPALTIFVEILSQEAFLYLNKFRGAGGLPVGVSGKVLALLSGGIDSPVASYRMMKRGCQVSFIHFHSYPFHDKASWEKAEELVEHLTPYQFQSRLYLVPFGEIQREIVLGIPPPLRVVLYRRCMLRIAQAIALQEGAKALVTGESLGQVASQTLQNCATIQEAVTMPILRPLIGSDKEEIIAQAREIKTFEISIQPGQDCCQFFIPVHPATGASIDVVRKAEERFDIEGWVKMGLDGAKVRIFH
jgi:thiamine biosynthesis protein ThiI